LSKRCQLSDFINDSNFKTASYKIQKRTYETNKSKIIEAPEGKKKLKLRFWIDEENEKKQNYYERNGHKTSIVIFLF